MFDKCIGKNIIEDIILSIFTFDEIQRIKTFLTNIYLQAEYVQNVKNFMYYTEC